MTVNNTPQIDEAIAMLANLKGDFQKEAINRIVSLHKQQSALEAKPQGTPEELVEAMLEVSPSCATEMEEVVHRSGRDGREARQVFWAMVEKGKARITDEWFLEKVEQQG